MVTYFQDGQDQWRFRVKGKNGEIVVTSEGYTRKRDAVRGFMTLQDIMEEIAANES
jgi:uncharacterized protein YegP (UPF0339 family)